MKKQIFLNVLLVVLVISALGNINAYAQDGDNGPDNFIDCYLGCIGNPDLPTKYCQDVCACATSGPITETSFNDCREKYKGELSQLAPPTNPHPYVKYLHLFQGLSPKDDLIKQ